MLVSKKVLGLCEVVAKDRTRIALTYLHVKGCTVQATNGHILAKTSFPGLDENDFPGTPGESLGEREAFITPEQLKAPFAIAKKNRHLPILQNVRVALEEDKSVVTGTDTNNPVIMRISQKDIAPYPNTNAVYPDTPASECVDITLIAGTIIMFAGMLKKAGISGMRDKVHLRIDNPMMAIKFYIDDPDGEPITGVMMPGHGKDRTEKLDTVK